MWCNQSAATFLSLTFSMVPRLLRLLFPCLLLSDQFVSTILSIMPSTNWLHTPSLKFASDPSRWLLAYSSELPSQP
jgi:hypothetical protein